MSQYEQPPVSGWALGGIAFAGTLMIMSGAFQAIAGLVAILDDEFYVVARNYTFDLDVTAWGWVHLILGAVLVLLGFSLLARKLFAGIVALILVTLSAVVNFFFIPYYPFWAIVVIALDVWIIWALTRPGALRA
ncbi:MAG: DUF7144 family membrane protein [Gaiellaceae bacterium]